MRRLNLFEAFSGYGTTALALEEIVEVYREIEIQNIGHCDIDDHANAMYEKIHGEKAIYTDITKVDWSVIPQIDILSWTSPCQSLSNAGKKDGFEEGSGTESSLAWEIRKVLQHHKPRLILMENVPGIINKRNKATLELFNEYLESKGYHIYYKVINSAELGWPQARERFFELAILDDIVYEFPKKEELQVTFAQLLDDEDSSNKSYRQSLHYHIDKVLGLGRFEEKGPRYGMKIFSKENAKVSNTITCSGIRIYSPYICTDSSLVEGEFLRVKERELSNNQIDAQQLHDAVNRDQIRRLSVRESWKLMGVPEKYGRFFEEICKTHAYKMLGNAIVMPTLKAILEEYFKKAVFVWEDDKDEFK